MRVKKSLRGLIVDEGRLGGLLVADGSQGMGGLIVDERARGLGEYQFPEISTAGAFALAAVQGVASYLLWTNGWRKLGGFLGFTAATGLVWQIFKKKE